MDADRQGRGGEGGLVIAVGGERVEGGEWGDSPLAPEFELFETVHDLVETHDQMSSVRDEQSAGTVEAWTRSRNGKTQISHRG